MFIKHCLLLCTIFTPGVRLVYSSNGLRPVCQNLPIFCLYRLSKHQGLRRSTLVSCQNIIFVHAYMSAVHAHSLSLRMSSVETTSFTPRGDRNENVMITDFDKIYNLIISRGRKYIRLGTHNKIIIAINYSNSVFS